MSNENSQKWPKKCQKKVLRPFSLFFSATSNTMMVLKQVSKKLKKNAFQKIGPCNKKLCPTSKYLKIQKSKRLMNLYTYLLDNNISLCKISAPKDRKHCGKVKKIYVLHVHICLKQWNFLKTSKKMKFYINSAFLDGYLQLKRYSGKYSSYRGLYYVYWWVES